ncbi:MULTISPECIES: thermonuclease family protein [Bacillus]|nr:MULTISPECIES: thermonuclease family protein [Bacillus cereus group]MCH5471463.1 thermonuclease family protein [Bacillus toyonensis]UFI00637.1 thermonuclease family protein [Bacillus toyonensis]
MVNQVMKPVSGESKKQNANRIIKATILEHIDGDTLRVKLANGKVEVVRFLCIDTPEVHHPRLGLQPFGLEGAAFTAKYAPVGKEVELEMDVGERDKFTRLVVYVWVEGQLLNRMLVERGLARVAYIYQPNKKYVDYLGKTQKKAQKDKRGIWSVEDHATSKGYDASKIKEK